MRHKYNDFHIADIVKFAKIAYSDRSVNLTNLTKLILSKMTDLSTLS